MSVELFPDLKKRLILLTIILLAGVIVIVLVPIKSASFILYMGLTVVAFCYCLVRLFNRKAILRLSPSCIDSRMSVNAEKMGPIPWSEITSIEDRRHFWFIKAIELHADQATTAKYQSRIHKKYRSSGKTFLISLSNEEINMTHEKLLNLVETYWNQYRNQENAETDHE